MKKKELINEKYGIEKKWRAEKNGVYFYIEDIKVLNHNLKCKEETIEIQRRRLERAYEVLEEDGYSLKEINEMLNR